MTISEEDRKMLDTDFSRDEVQREELSHYSPLVKRGSYRMSRDLIRTEAEQKAFIDNGLKAKLPHPRVHRSLFSAVRSFLNL